MFGVSLRQRRTNAPLSMSVLFAPGVWSFGVVFAIRYSVFASTTESFGRAVFGADIRCCSVFASIAACSSCCTTARTCACIVCCSCSNKPGSAASSASVCVCACTVSAMFATSVSAGCSPNVRSVCSAMRWVARTSPNPCLPPPYHRPKERLLQPREHLFVENAALFQSLGKPLARLIEDEGAGHALPVVAARLPVVHPVDDLGRLMATLDTPMKKEVMRRVKRSKKKPKPIQQRLASAQEADLLLGLENL